LKESDPIWVLRSGFQGNYKDVRGFVSDHSRKDAKRVIAKRLMQDDSSFVGQEVNIKQKTKQRQGTILKVNPTKALVEVDEGGQQRKYHVPYSMLQALPEGTPKATVTAPRAKPKTAPKAKSKAKAAVPKAGLKRHGLRKLQRRELSPAKVLTQSV